MNFDFPKFFAKIVKNNRGKMKEPLNGSLGEPSKRNLIQHCVIPSEKGKEMRHYVGQKRRRDDSEQVSKMNLFSAFSF